VKEDLWQLDLTAKELLGKVRAVVWPILVRADDLDVAVESLLAQRKSGSVTDSASTNDDYSFRGHRSIS